MIELFKVVREDYTDCWSGKIKYTMGTTLVHPMPGQELCEDGVYHACRMPEQAMRWRNGQWPVRLLKIATPEVVVEDAEYGNEKVGVHKLTVVEELPLHLALGPNGRKVMDFIDRMRGMKWLEPQRDKQPRVTELIKKHLEILQRFGAKQVPVRFITDYRTATRAAAKDAARDPWNAARDAARVAVWDAARAAVWDAASKATWDAAREATRNIAHVVARDVAWDAIGATAHTATEGLADFPNPFAPLVDIWELGYWPIGVVDGEFLVFEKK